MYELDRDRGMKSDAVTHDESVLVQTINVSDLHRPPSIDGLSDGAAEAAFQHFVGRAAGPLGDPPYRQRRVILRPNFSAAQQWSNRQHDLG